MRSTSHTSTSRLQFLLTSSVLVGLAAKDLEVHVEKSKNIDNKKPQTAVSVINFISTGSSQTFGRPFWKVKKYFNVYKINYPPISAAHLFTFTTGTPVHTYIRPVKLVSRNTTGVIIKQILSRFARKFLWSCNFYFDLQNFDKSQSRQFSKLDRSGWSGTDGKQGSTLTLVKTDVPPTCLVYFCKDGLLFVKKNFSGVTWNWIKGNKDLICFPFSLKNASFEFTLRKAQNAGLCFLLFKIFWPLCRVVPAAWCKCLSHLEG